MSTLAPSPLSAGIPAPSFIAANESAPGGSFDPSPGPGPRASALPSASGADDAPVLITGGAGFIGSNLADRLLAQGRRVRVFDNISRPGVERNLAWLRARHRDRLQLRLGDVRDPHALAAALRGAGPVFHLAAQVDVTASLSDPTSDFDINARGTLNLLEAIRRSPRRHPLVFTSTSRIYDQLEDLPLVESPRRCEPAEPELRHGFDESRPLSFRSPHGCSKGAADHYVLDYARTFDLPAVVFRLGAVYGPRQDGDDDQGWITRLLLDAIHGRPVVIRGDGRQVRDALHVDDLVDAFLRAWDKIDRISGRAFNLGGGPARTLSPLELVNLVRELRGDAPALEFAERRPGDPRYDVSDIRRFCTATGWAPRISLPHGVGGLHRWLLDNPDALEPELAETPATASSAA